MNPLEFINRECELQQDDSAESISGFKIAYIIAYTAVYKAWEVDIDLILMLGKLTKPDRNSKGFRKTPVVFSNGKSGAPYSEIERMLNNLLQAKGIITPLEFYVEFEKIHPFEDGNGRVGALLYNIFNGTIFDPVLPPEALTSF